MSELTYGEHVMGKRKILLENYDNEVISKIRNIKLNIDDLDNSILSDSFFNRDDISSTKKEILKRLTDKLKEELKKLTL